MPTIRTVVTYPYTTGVPADVAQNNIYFDVPDPYGTDEVTEIVNRVKAHIAAFDQCLSQLLNRAANTVRIELYNLEDPIPRVPIWEANTTLAAVTSGRVAAPPECAVCISYRGVYLSGVNNARRRGRMYIGPVTTVGTDANRPDGTLITALIAGGEALWTPIGAGDVVWVQRSETTGATTPVVAGWVDNAWDTQRRRGYAANTRTPLGAPPT